MSDRKIFSVVGIFDSAQHLMNAIPDIRKRVNAPLEAYTPYPVEGLDKLLGHRKSPVGGMVLVMGIIGALSALGFELWTSGRDYPQVTAGKPLFSWEAFVPIMFEVTVLFAAFTAGLGMLLLLNRLPMFRHPMLRSSSLPLVTRDRFALAVEARGAEIDVEKITRLLQEFGAKSVEVVEEPAPAGVASPKFFLRTLTAIGIVCILAGFITYWTMKLFPIVKPMVHMLDQPRLNPQSPSRYFSDGSGMRMPVSGTVARGSVPYTIRNQELAGDLVNPLYRTETVLRKGRQAYMNNCSVCHGVLGDGKTSLTKAYGAKPANLVSQSIAGLPDGKLYHVIVAGKNAMASYSAELGEDERWATVHYLRVLQRAANARDEDIPK